MVTHTRDEARLFISIIQQLGAGPGTGLSALAPASIVDGYRQTWPGAAGATRLLGTNGPEVVPYPEQRSRALWAADDLGPFRPEA
jgi:hypothetical protein